MNTFTLALNTATNAFAIPSIVNCWTRNRKVGFGITLTSFIASCLMHITETKHGLRPLFLAEYSNLFLNIDRLTSAFSFAYGIYSIRAMNFYQIRPLFAEFLIGLIALRTGEYTENLILYNLLHTIWHYTAFHVLDKAICYSK